MKNKIEKSSIEIIKAQRDLAIKLNSTNNFDDLLKHCLDSAITISGMDSGGIYLVDSNSGDIELKAHKGLGKEFVSIGKYYKSNAPQAEIIMKGDPVYILSNQIASLLNGIQKKEGLSSLAILPIKNENKVIACINVASHCKNEIHKSLILPLETMLAVIGNAIAKLLTEERLKQSEEKFSKAFNSTSVIMAISEIDSGKFIEVNETFLKSLGFQKDQVIGKSSSELGLFAHPDQRNILMEKLKKNKYLYEEEVEIKNNKKEKLSGLFYADIIKIAGKPHLLTAMQDITKRKKTEIELQNSLEEKDILLKEVHHRVKNNLQIISSLLDLQANTIGDVRFKQAIENSQNRILSMGLVHEMIYNSRNLSSINSKEYLEKLIIEISRSWSNNDKIDIKFDIDDINFDLGTAIPYALIINELITNCFQHAFKKSKTGKIKISLKNKNGKKQLRVKDNGIGLEDNIDISSLKSLGLKLVNILTRQLNGNLTINIKNGTEFIIDF